jgi:hypothetical protein
MLRKRQIVLLALLAAALLIGTAPAVRAADTEERVLEAEGHVPANGALVVENLLGSIRLGASLEPGVLRVEARVVAEAKTSEEARALADSVELLQTSEGNATRIHVTFPDGHTAFRPPKGGVKGWFSRWSDSFLRGDPVTVEYDGRQVRVGHDRKATGLAVHVRIWLPLDIHSTLVQTAGAVEGRALRGDIDIRTAAARVDINATFGALRIETDRGDVSVTAFQGRQLSLSTGAGDIEVNDIRAEKLALNTDNGAIAGIGLDAQELSIETVKGNVKLGGVEPVTAEVRTHSGEVDLATHFERTRSALIEAIDGNVTLRVGTLTYFDLLAETKSGGVKTTGLELDDKGPEGSAARYQHGSGGAQVRVNAPLGSVTVRPYDASRLDILIGNSGS